MGDTSGLPPRPDQVTGLPRPPWAPDVPPGSRTPSPPARPRRPPPGRGPAQDGFSGSRRQAAGCAVALLMMPVVLVVGVAVAVGAGLPDVVSVLRPRAAEEAAVGAFLVLVVLSLYRGIAGDYWAAGSDWLQVGRRWVDLYDLRWVRVRTRGNEEVVQFRDGAGRRLEVGLAKVRRHPLLWDLVHLGVRWSCATREVELDGWPERLVAPVFAPAPEPPRWLRGPVLAVRERAQRRRRARHPRIPHDDPWLQGLPERPDPWTGEPLPPPAPWTSSTWSSVALTSRPSPPDRGPPQVLRWRFSRPGLAITVTLVVAVLVLLGLVNGLPETSDGWFITIWLSLGGGALMGLSTAAQVTAGTDWLWVGAGWVDLYDLVAVHGVRDRWGSRRLRFTDGEGRRASVPVDMLLADQLLAALVDAGLRWSRARQRLEHDDEARRVLALDDPR